MTHYYQELLNLSFLFIFSIILGFIIILFSLFFNTYTSDSEKTSAYECGFDPYEDARNTFDIRFYMVAILFVIFDLEAVYFFPWCVSISFLNIEAYWGMFDFLLELFVGFIYAWKTKAFEWD